MSDFENVKDTASVSMYSGGTPATLDEVMLAGTNLMSAFPQTVTKPWLAQMARLAQSVGITKERINDAVDNIILHHHYPTLTIADVLDFDVRLKLYSHKEVIRIEGKFDDDTLDNYPRYCRTEDGRCFHVRMAEVMELPPRFRQHVLNVIDALKKKLNAETERRAGGA